MNLISTSFSFAFKTRANIGIISRVANLSFRSILLKIEGSISNSAATLRSGNPCASLSSRKYYPKESILIVLS